MVWSFLVMTTIGYNVILWTIYYDFGFNLRPFLAALLLIATILLVVMCGQEARELYVTTFGASANNGLQDVQSHVLRVSYLFCLVTYVAVKVALFATIWWQGYTAGLMAGTTYWTIATVLVMSGMHSRLAKLESLTSSQMLLRKRNFVRYISHEIRTPLNTVAMGIHYLRGMLSDGPDQQRQVGLDDVCTILGDVDESCNVAIGTLNDILAYDKLQDDDMVMDKESVSTLSLIRDALHPFLVQVVTEGVQLHFDDESCMPPSLMNRCLLVDVNKTSQVLRNLVSNALKFTKRGGTVKVISSIRLSTSDVAVAAGGDDASNESSELLHVSVVDTGVGISKENQKRLFKEVIQFDAADLQHGNGSGLGLWSK
jgi:signal transduction histidine kinase